MPTYLCMTREGLLAADRRAAIAAAISNAHHDATGAPAFFAQVVFDEKPEGRRFLGGAPSDGHIWVRGDVRAGRTPAQRRGLVQAITREVAAIAGVAETQVWVYLCELAPGDMVEYGHVLPEPGEEQAWFEGLPPALQAYLKSLGEAATARQEESRSRAR